MRTTHRSRDCPGRSCGKCGKRGHQLPDCPNSGEDVVTDFVDDDSIRSDADAEALIGIDMAEGEETRGKCAFVIERGGVKQQAGGES